MTSPSKKNKIRRCRPLLGTFVELSATGLEKTSLARAVGAAFGRIEKLQRLMSVHDPESELSRVNAEAFLRPVRVSAETFEVLQRGLELACDSAGAFDFTVAPLLARWGLLPASLRRHGPGDWRDIQLLARGRVRFTKPLAIDLGGIAKGYAVDAAIETLRDADVSSALVNAGGDLRVFGSPPAAINLRHPLHGALLPRTMRLGDAALATSSPCFTECRWQRLPVSHLVNPLQQRAVTGGISVTVRASECWLADALTKVVLNAPALAERLLTKHGAEAFVFTA
jgi:thiamine biosynthesis lipoprotein